MPDPTQPPQIPWWVRYWTDPTTTRSGLRQQAWLFLLLAGVVLGVGALSLYWQPAWGGVIVRPVAFGVWPGVFVGAGIWTLFAARWLDRHRAERLK